MSDVRGRKRRELLGPVGGHRWLRTPSKDIIVKLRKNMLFIFTRFSSCEKPCSPRSKRCSRALAVLALVMFTVRAFRASSCLLTLSIFALSFL